MALEKEIETFTRLLPTLTADEGKFVLIQDGHLVGTYVAYSDAIQAGYEKFGLEPFLVKQIHAVEQVQFVTRLLDLPCHS